MPVVHYIHRSGLDEYNRCPRAYFNTYGHAGIGLTPTPYPIYFAIGSAVHEGLAQSMAQAPVEHSVFTGLEYLRKLSETYPRDPNETLEASKLVEGLLRAWYANGYEQFHRTYQVLTIEQEVLAVELLAPEGAQGRLVELRWTSKPDAIVKEKYGPTTVGISWKTIDDANEYRRSHFSYDVQGLFEQTFGSLWLQQQGINDRVDAIQTIFLQKGKRLKPPSLGFQQGTDEEILDYSGPRVYGTDNFLTRRWVLDSHSEYSPFFNEMSVEKNKAWLTRYYKPGNKSYNTLAGFQQLPISQSEIASWIERLKAHQVFPTPEYMNGESALDRVIIWQEPEMRNDELAQKVIREQRHTSARIALGLNDIALATPATYQATLERAFPSSGLGQACNTPVRCPYHMWCYQPSLAPNGHELPQGFAWRVPHHESERLYKIGGTK